MDRAPSRCGWRRLRGSRRRGGGCPAAEYPGGIASIHGDSARGGLFRFEQLIQKAVVTVPHRLIAEAIDLVMHLEGRVASGAYGRLPPNWRGRTTDWSQHSTDRKSTRLNSSH